MSLNFPLSTVRRWLSGKEAACQRRSCQRCRFDPWLWKILWNRKWQPTPIFLPVKCRRQRSTVGYNSWGRKELDMIEHIRTVYLNPML